MAACIHGDVCRAWMRQTGSIAPLRASCPNCPWFNRDCMRDWQGRPVVTCRAMF